MPEHDRPRRLLVEAFVIVGSILLAFAIDAAWDERQETSAAEELARDMINDLGASLADIERAKSGNQRKADASLAVLDALRPPELQIPVDSLNALIAQSTLIYRLAPVNRSYDQLVATGLLRRLEPEVREGLAAWRQQQDNTITYHERDLLDFRQNVGFPFLADSEVSVEEVFQGSEFLDARAPRFRHSLQSLRESREVNNVFTLTGVLAANVLREYSELEVETRAMRDLLEARYGR